MLKEQEMTEIGFCFRVEIPTESTDNGLSDTEQIRVALDKVTNRLLEQHPCGLEASLHRHQTEREIRIDSSIESKRRAGMALFVCVGPTLTSPFWRILDAYVHIISKPLNKKEQFHAS